MKQPPSAQQIQDYLDRLNRLNRLHQWFRMHHIAITEDPHDHQWTLNDARTGRGDVAVYEGVDMDEEDWKEIIRKRYNSLLASSCDSYSYQIGPKVRYSQSERP